MADYLVKARPKKALKNLKVWLDSGDIARMRPFGEALDYSLKNARVDTDGWAVWEENDYCSPPLAMEREAVLDTYFTDLSVEKVAKGKGWAQIDHLSHLWRDSGMALLVVLVLLFVVAGSSASFIWFMNQQQTRAGMRYRSAAALSLAEAGVHEALSVLEGAAPGGASSGRVWRPAAHTRNLTVGTLEGRYRVSLADDAGGAILITSVGEVGGVTRRLRARVYLASPALLTALHGTSLVHLERPPAALVILPYGAGIRDRPWIHIAAGQGIEFATTDVSINDPSLAVEAAPGPVDAPESTNRPVMLRAPGPVRLLLARGADLTLGSDHRRVDFQQLRVAGVRVDGVVLRSDALPTLPEVDRDHYRALAAANTANEEFNAAAGHYVGDSDLARKRDSLYTRMEFGRLLAYLRAERLTARLRGVIYLTGGLSLGEGQRLQVVDGALVTESTVFLAPGAALEVTHSAATRTLPGIIVLDDGALVVTREARLRAHGLVYINGAVDIGTNARVDIVGAVLANDSELSFRSFAASVVIRYDPAVFGTPGLRVRDDAPVVAWVAAWEELP